MLYAFESDGVLAFTTKESEIEEMIERCCERFELDEGEWQLKEYKQLFAFLSVFEVGKRQFIDDYIYAPSLKKLLKLEASEREGWYSYKRKHLYWIDANGNYTLLE